MTSDAKNEGKESLPRTDAQEIVTAAPPRMQEATGTRRADAAGSATERALLKMTIGSAAVAAALLYVRRR